ncbi:MAG: Exoribonuclease R, ribonuclease R [Berkelbacteria bacterium GW2011_GWE1_39_12]|uniref:Exoribonuclease R, ribonuclease R n=1 Tax=Berkelbacteria bacterium GW2011_GWE1_39_12 TaxID=1618337 RepID=A0A0G4B5W9_9BACT|nr:MAG: Exoribonuclease R, ribonuclease R [Berkelbacteria bacterium GW2011_GWE1_39_12]
MGACKISVFTIDKRESRILDDAINVERIANGWTLRVAITDTTEEIIKGSVNDQKAESLIRSHYSSSREFHKHMLPTTVSEKLSMTEGMIRSAIVVDVFIDKKGKLGKAKIHHSEVEIRRKFTYDEVNSILSSSHHEDPYEGTLRECFKLAKSLLKYRKALGAITISDQSGWTTTEDGLLVKISPDEVESPSKLIICEIRVVVNQLVAQFLAAKKIPALYRNQEVISGETDRKLIIRALQKMVLSADCAEQLARPNWTDSRLGIAVYSTEPKGHFALNLPAYIHINSPLRKYADIVNQRILMATIKGDLSPYSKEELEKIAERINKIDQTRIDARRQIFHCIAEESAGEATILRSKTTDLAIKLCNVLPESHTNIHSWGNPICLANILLSEPPILRRYKLILLKEIKKTKDLSKRILAECNPNLYFQYQTNKAGKIVITAHTTYKDMSYQASGVNDDLAEAINLACYHLLYLVSGAGKIETDYISNDPETFFGDPKGRLEAICLDHGWPIQYQLLKKSCQNFYFQARLDINDHAFFSEVQEDSSYELSQQKAAADLLHKLNDVIFFMINPSFLEIEEENYIDALNKLSGNLQAKLPVYEIKLPTKDSPHFTCHIEFQPNGKRFRNTGTGNRKILAKNAAAKAILAELFPYQF